MLAVGRAGPAAALGQERWPWGRTQPGAAVAGMRCAKGGWIYEGRRSTRSTRKRPVAVGGARVSAEAVVGTETVPAEVAARS